jgi:hypothetical protein
MNRGSKRGTWRKGSYTEDSEALEIEHFLYRAPYGEPMALEREGLAKMFNGPEMVLYMSSCYV